MKKLFLLLFLLCPTPCLADPSSVLLNELAWMGTAASANDEWLELYNPSAAEIDLAGWRLEAADGAPKVMLAGIIPAGGYWLLERTDDETVPGVPADLIYTGSLGNDGEDIRLYDQNNNLIDEINAAGGWPGGENETKKTLERKDAAGWQTSAEAGGTPKAQNSGSTDDGGDGGDAEETAPPAADPVSGSSQPDLPDIKRGDIAINEIFPDPAGVDSKKEFLELKNISGNIIDLAGGKISNTSGQEYIFPEVILFPTNIAVFYRQKTGLVLLNEKEKITIYSQSGKIVDQKSYENAAVNLSYQRTAAGKWCWGEITPAAETICEPEVFPAAKISGPKNAAVGQVLIFDASDSYDPKNRPLNFRWDFGGGKTTDGVIVFQIYEQPGNYEISLTAAAGGRASTTVKHKIKISGGEPTTTTSPPTIPAATTTPTTIPDMPIYQNYDPPKIFISEFLPNPDKNLNQEEFIELAGAEDYPADLSGWRLTDSARGKFVIPAGTIIRPDAPLAFFGKQTKIALNNGGDTINLISPDGQLIDSAKYGVSKKGVSYILDQDLEWQESQMPTPGEINVLPAAAKNQAAATIRPKILGAKLETKPTTMPAATTTPTTLPNAINRYWRYVLAGFIGSIALAGAGWQKRQKNSR